MKTKLALTILFIAHTAFAELVVSEGRKVLRDGVDIGTLSEVIRGGTVAPDDLQAAVFKLVATMKAGKTDAENTRVALEIAKTKDEEEIKLLKKNVSERDATIAAADKARADDKAKADAAIAAASTAIANAKVKDDAASTAAANAKVKADAASAKVKELKAREEASGKGKRWEILDELEGELNVTAADIRKNELQNQIDALKEQLKAVK